ncbi:MAG TPA: hypothetical protein VF411_07090, partial [Bacteroidia bacterium]
SVYPNLSDTIRYLDNGIKKNKIRGDLIIKNTYSNGNGTSPVQLIRYSSTPLYLYFSTGCFTKLKKVSIKKDNKEMILNFCSIPSEVDILFDSIKFIPGEITYNISQIIEINKLSYNIRTPENNSPWDYIIPCNLIQTSLAPRLKDYIQEYKNDTLYYYADSLKIKITAKGKIETLKNRERRFDELNMKWVKLSKNSFVKTGTWVYYFDNYTLKKTENWRKMTRKERNNDRHIKHPRNEEVGF